MVLLGFLQRGDNFDRKVFAALVVESYLKGSCLESKVFSFASFCLSAGLSLKRNLVL